MFLNDLLELDDRTKLMVIDWIIDTMPDELGDELTDGLAVAFERAEENRPRVPHQRQASGSDALLLGHHVPV